MDMTDWLIDCVTQDVVSYIIDDTGNEYDDAIGQFYSSKTFEYLNDKSLDLYKEGSAYIYQLYRDEVYPNEIV
ncbi:MAG: hypothetical protein IKQ61_06030 [Spirochaetales bacterium]|nr:hypothetical protein [Spirochaetales bacterium]MBR6199805.1 hypothetical protein [Spirochaetales bacterium]